MIFAPEPFCRAVILLVGRTAPSKDIFGCAVHAAPGHFARRGGHTAELWDGGRTVATSGTKQSGVPANPSDFSQRAGTQIKCAGWRLDDPAWRVIRMCEKCKQLDEKIAHYRRIATQVTDEQTIKNIENLIKSLEAKKTALHQ